MSDEIPEPNKDTLSKEDLLQRASQAVNIAVRVSRGAALVNVGGLGATQDELAQMLSENYHVASVDEILKSGLHVPKDKSALAVTGYSEKFYDDREKEERIEAHIRAMANERNLNSGEFSLVVLSDSMPNANLLHNSSLPWFNGPFQDDDSVWSLKSAENNVELTRHDLQIDRGTFERSWIDKKTIPLD